MVGRTNTTGASNGPIKKGTIVVSYPAGAICAVNNGIKTYTALDTSGAAAFSVDPGTWTVRAYGADGDSSENVSVTAGGWVSVELSFDIILFESGMTTGTTALGWKSASDQVALEPNINYDAEAVYVGYDVSIGGRTGVAHWGAYDLTKFSTIKVNLTMTGIWTSAYAQANGLFVWKELSTGYYPDKAVAKHQIASNNETLLTVDVSALAGVHYIGMGLRRGDTTPTYRITRATVY